MFLTTNTMTEEQQKAIDACKDQAAQEYMLNSFHDVHYGRSEALQNVTNAVVTRAMQIYGEQCRKEAEKEINTLKSKMGNMKASLKKYQRNED